jgi:ABC-type phosphate transport system substrate-binding protein
MKISVPKLARTVALGAVVVALSTAAFAKDAALIVGKASPIKALTAAELAKALKASPPKWADGKEVVFIIKAPASNETKVLGTKLLNQTVESLPAYLAGAKKTFLIVETDADVIKAVNTIPHAIGVVDLYSINGSVTVLKVDGKLPLEPGYLLHYN